MKAHVLKLARYNAWANERLYDAVAEVPDAQYRENRGAFFRSLRGTLNHILVADRAWLTRITGKGKPPTSLDEILYDDFAVLREARMAEDHKLIRTLRGIDEVRLGETVTYRDFRGEANAQTMFDILAHVFNHQTHHRGQAHTLLTQMGFAAPALDLIYFLRQ